MPHPMFMSFQGVPGASRLPYIPPFHPFPFAPVMPNGFPPRYANGVFGGHYNGEGPPQLRKLFIGGLSHETTDEQVCFHQLFIVAVLILIRSIHCPLFLCRSRNNLYKSVCLKKSLFSITFI